MCKKFNVDLSRRTKHNALLDCELLREVYINLLDVKEPKLDLSQNLTFDKKLDQIKKAYNKKIIQINELEIKKHKLFLKMKLRKISFRNFFFHITH